MKLYFKTILIVSLFFVGLPSCINKPSQEKRTSKIAVQSREEKLRNLFTNKQIHVINNFLSKDDLGKTKILFLYTGYDCQSCIDKGYEVIKKIESLECKERIIVVSSHSNIGRDQERNDYTKFVHNDEEESIRKDLKFLPTPAIFLLDENNQINQVVFPETFSDVNEMVKQLDLV